MDTANLLIGAMMLAVGVLGAVYIVSALAITSIEIPSEGGVVYPSVDRFLVPTILPVGAVVGILAVIYLFSRILLVLPEAFATGVAFLAALGILFVCATLASVRRITKSMIATVVGIPLLILLVAGIISAVHLQATAKAAAFARASAPTTEPSETTTDNAFSARRITVPAGTQVTFTLTNKGQAVHNWHVLSVQGSDGKDITLPLTSPGATNTMTFTISQPGSYNFQCDVHPQDMTGTLTVK